MAVTLMEKGRHAGMWKVRVQPRDKNGARISVPTQYVEGTKKDAEKLERKLLVEAEEAVYDNYDAKKASLSESLERYINANFPEQSNSSPLRKCPKPGKILYF